MTSVPTILLLDQEPILRGATALMLTHRGGVVCAVGTEEEAVAVAARRLFDVAIVDLPSPQVSAVDLVRRLRAGGLPPRRVILCSDVPLDRLAASDFTEVLLKPYAFERLLLAVFSDPGRRRPTRSGVFPVLRSSGAASAGTSPRRSSRALDRSLRAHLALVPRRR